MSDSDGEGAEPSSARSAGGGTAFGGALAALELLSVHRPLMHRLAGAMAANAAGRLATLLLQLLSLAVMPREWGADRFGLWLMISAAATYLALGGLGFGAAGQTEMTLRVARGDPAGAGQVYRTVWIFVGIATMAVAAVGLAAVGVVSARLGIDADTTLAIAFTILYGVLAVQALQQLAALRASGRYALAGWVTVAQMLVEGVAAVAAVAMGGGLAAAAGAKLGARAIGAAPVAALVARLSPWTRETALFDRELLRRLLKPAAASLGLTLSSLLSLQGLVITLGLAVSPAAAAIYASARTISRAPLQLSDLVVRASAIELTAAHGAGRDRMFDRLTLVNAAVSVLVLTPTAALVALFGADAARRLTGSAIPHPEGLFPLLALGALLLAVWTAVAQSVAAMNRHGRTAVAQFVMAVILVASPFFFGGATQPTVAVAALVAACQAVGLAAAVGEWLRLRRTSC